MPVDNFSKKLIEELKSFSDSALAYADKTKKLEWFNDRFKDLIDEKRLKGRKIESVFSQIDDDKLQEIDKKQVEIKLNGTKNLLIKPVFEDKNLKGFLLKITEGKKKIISTEETKLSEQNLKFQKELQKVLTLLAKEKSLSTLSEEILKKSVILSKSDFGIIVFHNDNDKYNYQSYDPENLIKNLFDVEKEIESNYSFITKWLKVNKRVLVVLNVPNNIGFNLAQVLQSDGLLISACIFDDKLLATIIVGKKKGTYSQLHINYLEQFSSLLAFSISSTKTKELNTTLENRLLQAQKLETIGKLSSGMAHDFSNLLSSIFGSLNLLKKRVPDREDITRLLDNIENCSIRAKDLTKGLLSYGKPTPKRKELIKPNILLSELIKVITQTFPKKLEVEFDIEDNLYDILGNGTEIYQVLLNLCVNAKEAIEGDGKIALKAKNMVVKENNIMDFPLLNKGNYVCFSVEDNGGGIEEENLQRIFDPYFSTKQKETGSGLGLYVTYGIIKAHQGHIDVSSEIGKGTVFNVFVPSYEPTKVEKITSTEKIVLLADDEVMLRDLLAELLESNGYNVIKVSTGVEVLKVLTEEIKVDLVIIDYNMPEMNGLECIEEIRKLDFKMPIILSTGSLSFSEDKDYDKYKIDSILAKPYEFETMLELLNKLF